MRAKKNAAPVKTQGQELVEAIKLLSAEKGISEEMLFATVEDALKKAYQKNLPKGVLVPSPNNITATIDRFNGEVHVYTRRLIVEEIETPTADQITLEEARKLKDTYQMGDILETDVTPTGFLRVAAQTAKGVIVQRLREAERGRVYEEYIDKENEILTAIVRRIDTKGNAFVDLMGRTEGILEATEMIPGETLQEEDHVKVYVLEVQRAQATATRGPQVRVSRIHPNLIKRLFEMEVPEIAAGDVTIKAIAREAGSRTKMAVHSNELQIDPVGSCVGQRGSRVDRVVNELKGEKIDIIKWSEDPAEFIANALNPANVREVYTESSGARSCIVVVPDNQLSLAIGKEGQNARLAAKLTGWKIDIKSQTQYAEQMGAAEPVEAPLLPAEGEFTTFDDFTLPEGDDDTL
ncbi:MAG: transcription termination/antitermination protein NusA [Clostridiales bacterium]|nr:transcription termination/antitermination protein NusA [Clostridiales bacterium]